MTIKVDIVMQEHLDDRVKTETRHTEFQKKTGKAKQIDKGQQDCQFLFKFNFISSVRVNYRYLKFLLGNFN